MVGFNRWGSSGMSSRETTKLEGVWSPGTNATGFVELEPWGSKFTGPRKNVQVWFRFVWFGYCLCLGMFRCMTQLPVYLLLWSWFLNWYWLYAIFHFKGNTHTRTRARTDKHIYTCWEMYIAELNLNLIWTLSENVNLNQTLSLLTPKFKLELEHGALQIEG